MSSPGWKTKSSKICRLQDRQLRSAAQNNSSTHDHAIAIPCRTKGLFAAHELYWTPHLNQRFSNWGPRTKGGPRRKVRKVVIVCTVFNNLRPIFIYYLFIMKFVQLGTQIKTRCEKKKIYKNTQKVHYEVHKNHIIKSTSDSQNSEIWPLWNFTLNSSLIRSN